MGHEVIIHGAIEGSTLDPDRYRLLQDRNAEVIRALPETDDFPWLTRDMFALPASEPQGTYRSQVIHFGLSLKDDPQGVGELDAWPTPEREGIHGWMTKFERLLAHLYWFGADLFVQTDFEPLTHVRYLPTSAAIDQMFGDDLSPVAKWNRTINFHG